MHNIGYLRKLFSQLGHTILEMDHFQDTKLPIHVRYHSVLGSYGYPVVLTEYDELNGRYHDLSAPCTPILAILGYFSHLGPMI